MQRGLSSTGLLPIAVIFSIYIKGRWSGMKAGHPKRTAHRGQTWGLIKAQPSQAQTGFEVRHIKSMGSKVRQRTDLHLTLQLEMVISRCNDDPCLTVRDDTTVGDTSHMCECECVLCVSLHVNAQTIPWCIDTNIQQLIPTCMTLACMWMPSMPLLYVSSIYTYASFWRIKTKIKKLSHHLTQPD